MNCYIPPDWRFVPVHGKAPIWNNWVNKGIPYFDPTSNTGIGLLLGPLSGGIVALDFDGVEAWEFAKQRFPGIEWDEVPAWYAGRQDHCQMVFRVPVEHWPTLKTIKVSPNKKLEFRWAGSQSVIPPSPHPMGRFYEWVEEPTMVNTNVVLPDEYLTFWLEQCSRPEPVPMEPVVDYPDMPLSERESMVCDLLEVIRCGGRPNYEDWIEISWAVASEVGSATAERILREYLPEMERGEYRRLLKDFQATKAPKMGTLVYLAGKVSATEVVNIKEKYRPGLRLDTQDEMRELRASRLFKRR